MRTYRTFTRTWWKKNPKWPNGLEPHMGRKSIYRRNLTEYEAQRICEDYNRTHNRSKLSCKMEYELEK